MRKIFLTFSYFKYFYFYYFFCYRRRREIPNSCYRRLPQLFEVHFCIGSAAEEVQFSEASHHLHPFRQDCSRFPIKSSPSTPGTPALIKIPKKFMTFITRRSKNGGFTRLSIGIGYRYIRKDPVNRLNWIWMWRKNNPSANRVKK